MASSLKLDKSQIILKIRFGADSIKKHKTTGRWPSSSQSSSFELPNAEIKLNSSKDILSGTIKAGEEMYLREIRLSMKVKCRKGNPLFSTGTYSGSPGLTISDLQEIIRFKRNKKMRQFISFQFNNSNRILSISWHFNCFLPEGKELHLDPLLVTENETGQLSAPAKMDSKSIPRTAWVAGGTQNQVLRINYIEENLSWMEKERFFFDMLRMDNLHNMIGDWDNLPTEFKGKIGFINRRIEHNGMIPAISFAPFHAEPGSELVRLHPDWFVGDLKGDALLLNLQNHKKVHILDFTQLPVKEYLKRTLDLFYRQWGFKAFNLQGLSALLLPCRHSDNEKGIWRNSS